MTSPERDDGTLLPSSGSSSPSSTDPDVSGAPRRAPDVSGGPPLTGPTLAPEAADLLRRLTELGLRPYAEVGVLAARHAVEAARWMQGEKVAVATTDLLVDGGDGRLPARVYRPTAAPSTEVPLVVWFHGGGWVCGSVASVDRPCRAIARAAGAVVVSVEYRRPPETPFPGPLEDAVAATAWCADHAAELGAHPGRVVIGGDSAGGNLAAAAARWLRDRVARQVLVYPVLAPPDPAGYPAHNDGYLLTHADMVWFWEHHLDGRPATPDAAPLLAPDDELRGLPSGAIAVAGFDPLHDEGVAYAERLRAAGVDVELRDWPDMIHGFLGMAGELPQTGSLITWIAAQIGRST
ncbi:alpha/beta hydrolase [Actinomycetospora sp. NBRC 106378]|uniref:alpha/beta hydrolase n=1 Tax=Actinomycetospora sp. NBRC 106378 TaxID=3032208 RepID=UPI0024A4BEF6|nr:alpha/beta hydrolase [Actinomycetospora sp. NBRC 106378]GLZ55323.1 acetylhydrolase [Actinomycetospora sp. NBRC 106378]